MCKSAQWWVAFKGGELPPSRLWPLLLLLGVHYSFVAFNHTMFVFQAPKPPSLLCREERPDGSLSSSGTDCSSNCSGRLVFDGLDDDATIVTEWSLVCSRAALRPLMSTLYFLGVAAGALVCGLLADRLGRRAVMMGCLLGQAVLGVGLSFAPSLEAFAALRVLHGAFVQGLQGSTFTLLLELFPSRLRTAVGVVLEIYWALGLAVLAGLAYLLPHWRDLQLAVSAPTLVTMLLLPWIPESRLWLASRDRGPPPFRRGLPGHGSYREKLDDTDGTLPSPPADKDVGAGTHAPRPPATKQAEKVHVGAADEPPVTTMDLVSQTGLRTYTVCINVVWFTVPLAYYVTTFNVPSLTGDRFANFALGAAMEVAAYCVAFVALSRLGRRLPLFAFLAVSAVACFTVAYILAGAGSDGGVSALVLVLSIKALLVGSFCTMFLYTGELFPTAVRSAAIGICSLVGRLGSLLSAQVEHLGSDSGEGWPPFVLIGGLLLVASGFALLLPETLGKELPATLAEARALRVRAAASRKKRGPGPRGQGDHGGEADEQLLASGPGTPGSRSAKLNLDDYSVPHWKSDVPQLEPDQVQTAKKRESMSALELGQGLLDELNRTPCADRADRTRSVYLETNLDDPLDRPSTQYKTTVASAV